MQPLIRPNRFITKIEEKITELMAFDGKPAYLYNAYKNYELDEVIENLQALIDISNAINQQRVHDLLQKGLALKAKLTEYTELNSLNSRKPVLIKFNRRETVVEQEQIIYVEVTSNYSVFFCYPENVVKSDYTVKQLIAYEKELDFDLFHRISQKHIVNIFLIHKIDEGTVTLRGIYKNEPIILPLPKSNVAELKRRFIS